MIFPTKHQKPSSNILVIGAEILALLKKNDFNLEDLYLKVRKSFNLDLDFFLDTLTFLWLIGSISYNDKFIKYKKENASS